MLELITSPLFFLTLPTLTQAREIELLRARRDSTKPLSLKNQMYDEHGNLISWKNNVGEQDRHNQERAAAKPNGLKKQMFDADGNLVACANNDGEQDRHNPDMDLSPEGMMLKKQREMEELRRRRDSTKPMGIKQKMFDEGGQLNAWKSLKNKDERELSRSLPFGDIDSSAEGMKLKNVSLNRSWFVTILVWKMACVH